MDCSRFSRLLFKKLREGVGLHEKRRAAQLWEADADEPERYFDELSNERLIQVGKGEQGKGTGYSCSSAERLHQLERTMDRDDRLP